MDLQFSSDHMVELPWGTLPIRTVIPPGLPELSGGAAAMSLCARLVTPVVNEQILLLGCSHGALGVVLARAAHHGHVMLHDPNLVALQAAQRTIALNQIPNAEVCMPISQLPERAGQLDRVVIIAPQSRALARRWLVEALQLIRPGGTLMLAGANQLGIQSLSADAAALFGSLNPPGLGKGCRVVQVSRPVTPPHPPVWATTPGIAPDTWHTVALPRSMGMYELFSLPGIFSYEHLDTGTALLLQHFPPCAGAKVLDVGCGYGPLGVAAAALGATRVDMLDVNLLAVAAAQANATRYGLPGAVLASDGLTAVAGRAYDLIISNPPFHTGSKVDTAATTALISGSRALLSQGGRLVLVANRFLPYERLLAAHFSQVTRIAENKAYQVLVGM